MGRKTSSGLGTLFVHEPQRVPLILYAAYDWFSQRIHIAFFGAWLGQFPGGPGRPGTVRLQPERTLIVKYVHSDNAHYASDMLQSGCARCTGPTRLEILPQRLPADAVQQNFIIAWALRPGGPYRPEAETGLRVCHPPHRQRGEHRGAGAEPDHLAAPTQRPDAGRGAFLDKYCGVRLTCPTSCSGVCPPKAALPFRGHQRGAEAVTSYVSATGLPTWGNSTTFSGPPLRVVRRDWESTSIRWAPFPPRSLPRSTRNLPGV
jgi:hypothetical protein